LYACAVRQPKNTEKWLISHKNAKCEEEACIVSPIDIKVHAQNVPIDDSAENPEWVNMKYMFGAP
jgi:hypothetical protein